MIPHIFNLSLKEIEDFMNKHLNVKQDKKVESGEVFTPFHLVVEMINTFPKSVWKNPNLKWLDPGCGVGNFSMVVFYYLDKGLKNWESNSSKRRNHIIKNMLYMIEITPNNVKIVKELFGENVNVAQHDFLLEKDKWKTLFEVDKFDIILGNPPYNKNGMRGKGRSNIGLTVIWSKFVDLSLLSLNPKGFCLFFTPNSWNELKSPLSKHIMQHQILVLKNFDTPTAYKLFKKKAGSLPLCYYLLQKVKPTKKTKIYDSFTEHFVDFDIHKYEFIPNKNIELVKKVLSKTKENLDDYYYFTPPKVKKNKETFFDSYSNSHPYPLINYVHKKIYISYSSSPSFLQNGCPKLVFPNYSMGYPILDVDGILDVGGRSSYVLYIKDNDPKKLKKIQEFFLTNLALTLINSLKTAQKFLSTRTFTLFPDASKLSISINDKNLESYYKLSSKDKTCIEHQIEKGEGNLTEQRREEIMNFSLETYLSNNKIEEIKQKIKKSGVLQKSLKRKGKRNNKTKKNR